MLSTNLLPNPISGQISDNEEDSDPYSTDDFRIYEFKVRRCMRGRSHDWTECPFAHPGEKARRRDPRRYHYSGNICTDFRKGACRKGDTCEFSHGVFECWLHPARYRTEPCKDGRNCKRKVCFFAHTPRELRILPLKPSRIPSHSLNPCCCAFSKAPNIISHASSPTSTLMGLSHLSPPHSPPLSLAGFSPISYSQAQPKIDPSSLNLFSRGVSYKTMLTDVVTSLETMDISGSNSSPSSSINSWTASVRASEDQGLGYNVKDFNEESEREKEGESFFSRNFINDHINNENCFYPDFNWVDDLVM
ncbi:zinc finger CCCH domain-containing protein 2-like [Tasmannia lanceolata]|uniref:zinc finger CCCH domain-containing protein 2-like n=1 Tax=Tasmannia lanceolata TaxID=3420 RepID=UPI0040637D36